MPWPLALNTFSPQLWTVHGIFEEMWIGGGGGLHPRCCVQSFNRQGPHHLPSTVFGLVFFIVAVPPSLHMGLLINCWSMDDCVHRTGVFWMWMPCFIKYVRSSTVDWQRDKTLVWTISQTLIFSQHNCGAPLKALGYRTVHFSFGNIDFVFYFFLVLCLWLLYCSQ